MRCSISLSHDIRSSHAELRSAGILHAAIFGSVARGEAEYDSDIDILVDFDPAAKIGLFRFVGLRQLWETIMERDVSILHDKIEVF